MKKYIIILLITLILASAVLLVLKFFPQGRIATSEFDITEVEMGEVVSTIPAEGAVQPESEVLILSPASSIIQRIVKDVGSKVEHGEAIIILDPAPVQEEIENIEDQLKMKRNSLERNQLNARSIRVDLAYNVEVKKLRIASLKSELADQEQLLEVGGISPARYEQTKQELVLAEKDLETLNTRNNLQLQQLKTTDEGLKLQMEIQEKELEQKKDLLKKMIIRAPSSGIILSLDGQQGEKVSKDKLLVKMSNLSNFKIQANADDKHSEFVRTGNGVVIELAQERITGQIGTVSPSIRNKKVEFDVYLNESSHWRLRPDMVVPMSVIVGKADSVMRVKYGPSVERTSGFDIYKVEGNVAIRQHVTTGLLGDEYLEILSGLEPGDQVIISDVSLFRNRDRVDIYMSNN